MKNFVGKLIDSVTSIKHYMFVHITAKELTLAQAEKHKLKLHCSNIQKYPLQKTDIIGDKIFNMSRLFSLIRDYALHNNMDKPRLIAFIPLLAANNPYALLQITLCLSKKPFILDFLSHESSYSYNDTVITLPKASSSTANLLTFFLPQGYHTSKLWLTVTGSALIILMALTITHYIYTHNTINAYQSKTNTLTADINSLKTKVKILRELEKENGELETKIITINKLASCHHNPYNLFVTIAQKMPIHSHLTSLEIGTQTAKCKRNKKSPTHIIPMQGLNNTTLLLRGVTKKPSEISTLIENLSDSFKHAQFSLSHIRKKKQHNEVHKKAMPCLYTFNIQGILPIVATN